MSRKGIDACIFCSCVPCECNKSSKKAQPKKQVIAHPVVRPISDARAAMKAAAAAAAAGAAAPISPKLVTQQPQSRQIDPDTAVFASAIRSLAPVLHPDELKEYSVILNTVPSPEERAVVWRARRTVG